MEIPITLSKIDSFWRFPLSSVGDDNTDTIFLEVGRLANNFECLENSLCAIYASIVGTGADSAMRLFGHLLSSSKIVPLKDAFYSFIASNPEACNVQDFKTLMNHYSKAAKLRNYVIHGVCTKLSLNGEDVGYFLCPSWFTSETNFSYANEEHVKEMESRNDPLAPFTHRYRFNSTAINEISTKITAISDLSISISSQIIKYTTTQHINAARARMEEKPQI